MTKAHESSGRNKNSPDRFGPSTWAVTVGVSWAFDRIGIVSFDAIMPPPSWSNADALIRTLKHLHSSSYKRTICGLLLWLALWSERADCLVSRRVDIEYPVHTDKLEERPHLLRHAAQLQVPARGVQLPEARQDRTQPGAIDKAQLAQVEYHLGLWLQQRCHVAFEFLGVAGIQLLSWQDHHRHILHLLNSQFHEDAYFQGVLRFLTR